MSRHPAAVLTAVVVAIVAGLTTTTPAVAASTISATLSQCTNGAVGPPLVLEQCAGASGGGSVSILNGEKSSSGYANWVSGNSNGQKSHWRENEFIAYRAEIVAPPGLHTLQIHYDTVHSGGHAIDYLGSYDATESSATDCAQPFAAGCPTPPGFHANYNNPCADLTGGGLMSAADCPDTKGVAPTPRGTAAVPAVDTSQAAQTCGGSQSSGLVSNGGFSQLPGAFKLFGPSGSTMATDAVNYGNQNTPSGTGACSTTVTVAFRIGGTGNKPTTVVLAWGGHIASSTDWGQGNSATSISGSPYHMALDNLDGTTVGSQDRALSSSAVFFGPSVTTSLSGGGSTGPKITVSPGTSVTDTATLTGASPSAGGTVTYQYTTDSTCKTGLTSAGSAAVVNGVPGSSTATTFNTAGTYYWVASYSGDTASNTLPATSPCGSEVLTVSSPGAVQVVKTADAASVSAGSPIGYRVTISNTGSGPANGVTLTDDLPLGNASHPVTWSIDPTTGDHASFAISTTSDGHQHLILNNGPLTLAAGTSLTVHITAATSTANCATYDNTASVSSTNAGSDATDPVKIVVACPDISITKTADATLVSAGSPIGFTLTVSNAGPGTATNVTLTDPLPATGYTWTLDSHAGWTTCAIDTSTSPQALSCSVASLAPTDTTHPALTAHISSPTDPSSTASYTNTATVKADGVQKDSSASVTLIGACVLGHTESAAPTFNESTVTRAVLVTGSGLNQSIHVITNDETALLLGVNNATAPGTNNAAPFYSDVKDPSLGSATLDPTLRPQYPALFITDITNGNSDAGDWQDQAGARQITDGITTNGSNVFRVPSTSTDPLFTTDDVGKFISDGAGKLAIPSGTTILNVSADGKSLTMSNNASSSQTADLTVLAFAPKPSNLVGSTPWANAVGGSWSTATQSGSTYTVTKPKNKNNWDFGIETPNAPWRQITDGIAAAGSTTLTSTYAEFSSADVGLAIDDANGGHVIPAGTTIKSVTNSKSVVLSNPASAGKTGDTVEIGSLAPTSYSQLLGSTGNEGFGSDVGWNVSNSSGNNLVAYNPETGMYEPLAAGHAYRVQVMTHDGDQNKTGGDVGQFCANIVIPDASGSPSSPTAPAAGATVDGSSRPMLAAYKP